LLSRPSRSSRDDSVSSLSCSRIHPRLDSLRPPAEKYAKKLLGDNDVEAVLQRLDRLTKEEARTTVAQNLEVVYGLVNNIAVVMDGMRGLRVSLFAYD
jgi:hypothetical protein